MSKDNQERIEDILSLYNKKALIETALLSNEVDIIKNRSKVVDDYSDTKYGNLYYNVAATNSRDAKALYDLVHFSIFNDSNKEGVNIKVSYIVRAVKDLMTIPKNDNGYVSFTLSTRNDNYEFVLEVSGNFNDDKDNGDFLIIKAITKYDKDIIELINYNTNVTDYIDIHGDERAVITLLDDNVIVDIN